MFPDKLKVSKVVPIQKKDNKQKIENCRPIYLLPSIYTAYDKIVLVS